jgi:hypothetical protein
MFKNELEITYRFLNMIIMFKIMDKCSLNKNIQQYLLLVIICCVASTFSGK